MENGGDETVKTIVCKYYAKVPPEDAVLETVVGLAEGALLLGTLNPTEGGVYKTVFNTNPEFKWEWDDFCKKFTRSFRAELAWPSAPPFTCEAPIVLEDKLGQFSSHIIVDWYKSPQTIYVWIPEVDIKQEYLNWVINAIRARF